MSIQITGAGIYLPDKIEKSKSTAQLINKSEEFIDLNYELSLWQLIKSYSSGLLALSKKKEKTEKGHRKQRLAKRF